MRLLRRREILHYAYASFEDDSAASRNDNNKGQVCDEEKTERFYAPLSFD